jgi:maleylacetate reductase
MAGGWVVLPATERVVYGVAAAEALAAEAKRIGARRVFLLVSQSLRRDTDEIDRIEAALGDRLAGVASDIAPHSLRSDVLRTADAARAVGADLIVTIGGGSVTDAGKIVPLAIANNARTIDDFDAFRQGVVIDGKARRYEGPGPAFPAICIPTTLSGGEFNTLAGSTHDVTRHKQGYEHPAMAPVSVILDPALTRHTPDWIWFSTGVRAMDHAVEALVSYRANAYCDAAAASALKLLTRGLAATRADPQDFDARLDCQIGAWQAMVPIIGKVPMGASHAIGHALGGACAVPHGYTSCVMAPVVQSWNAEARPGLARKLGEALGAPDEDPGVTLDRIIRGLGMPRSLRAVGLTEDQIPVVAEHAMLDSWIKDNARPVTGIADVLELLRRAW